MEPSETGQSMGHEAIGVVESIGADDRSPVEIDLSEHTVLPGLIDCHALLIGEIDLSVASVMAFSACTLAFAYSHGVPFWLAIVLALVVAAAAGGREMFQKVFHWPEEK